MFGQLTVFNPFDLYLGARYHEPVQVQEIINYCGDRFRVLLNYMRDRFANDDIPTWFNRTLEGELAFALSNIGLATAIGLDVEVPHIIRLLAADLYRARAKRDRLDLDQSMNLYLDSGPVVPLPLQFAKSWWRVNRDPVSEEVLGPQTIDECLKVHRKRREAIEQKREAESDSLDPATLIDGQLVQQAPSRPAVPQDLLSQDTVTMLETMTPACPSCLPNRKALLKAFTKDQKHVRRFKTIRDTFQDRRDAAARRAAGFLKLHEAAITKEFQEVDDDKPQGSTSKETRYTTRAQGKKKRSDTSQQSALLRERAEEELHTLTALGFDAQWAAGPTLTLDDIRGLLQSGPVGPGAEHSGYQMDHITGPNTGRDSDTLSTLPSPDQLVHSDISQSEQPIPDLAPDDIPQLMLPGTVAGPERDPIGTYRTRTPPIPSYHINAIEIESISEGSVEQALVTEPHIETDRAPDENEKLAAGNGPGDAQNPIHISSRSPSQMSLSSDSLSNASETLEVNESPESDSIAGPEDVLGTTHSDAEACPADIGGTDVPDDDSLAGDPVIGEDQDASVRDELTSGHDLDHAVRPADERSFDRHDPAILAGSEENYDGDENSESDDADMLAGAKDLLEHYEGDEDCDNEDADMLAGAEDVLEDYEGDEEAEDEDADMLAGAEDVLENYQGDEDFYNDDPDVVAGPEHVLEQYEDNEEAEDEDGDMLAGAKDVLMSFDQRDDEEDGDDVSDKGLGGRALAARFLRDWVAGRTAGPSREPARDHPYTAEDFENVPEAWFP